MNIPINQSDKFSRIPEKKYVGSKYPDVNDQIRVPINEPTPNAFSKNTFEPVEEIVLPETVKEINVTYHTIIALSAILIIIGATLATFAIFAIYGPAISRGNLVYVTKELIGEMQYNTSEIHSKVNRNDLLLKVVNENIEKLGTGIVSDLKIKEAKIINQ